ncbi:MAG: hypothetical protein ACRDRR_03020 [Pseudonocardiaceae bacterium]
MTTAFAPDQAQRFIERVYPPTVAGKLHISSTDAWTGRQFDRGHLPELFDYVGALDQAGKQGIYLRVMANRPGAAGRGTAADSVELPGLWSDLDIDGPGHKHDPAKFNGLVLPPDEASARRIVAAALLPEPTTWIHSGGGLYTLHLLHAVLTVTDANRAGVVALSERWQAALAAGAKQLGFHYGTGVSDLARVLRLPGTVNRKVPGDARPCRILTDDGPRYSLAELVTALGCAEQALGIGTQRNGKQRNGTPGSTGSTGRPTAGQFMTGDTGRTWAHADPGTGTPFDDYESRTDWADILTGWTEVASQGAGTRCWVRPGKETAGISATTGRAHDRDRMWNFSDNAGLPVNEPLTKPFVYALLNHNGDLHAAAAELYRQGYGARNTDATTEEMGPTARHAYQQRPGLHVGAPAIAAEWLRENIGRGRLAGMFLRAGEIVHTPREGEEGYIPRTDDQSDGPAQIRPVTAANLTARIQYTYRCYRETTITETAGDETETPSTRQRACMFPPAAAKLPVEVPDMLPHLRALRGVTHSPVIRGDGSILHKPGYDIETGLLHLPEPGLAVPEVADRPSSAQVAAAVTLLNEMTAGFQFVTDDHKANYYGLLLTPLLRQITPPPYKLGAIGAPQPGSGKSLLAALLRIIHGGVFRSEVPDSDAELRKQITTILDVTSAPVIQLDNVSGVLRSSVMAGLLTSNRWDDRKLGSNTEISRPNDRLWVITGNNLCLGGDLPRRTLWVTIDPRVPNPHLRTDFAIPNLETWAAAHRGELIAALLTLVRAWVVAGRPTRRRAGDGYGRWIEAVEGILTVAGVPGAFDGAGTARATVGADDDEWAEFLAAVREVFGEASWTVKDLLAKVDRAGYQTLPIPLDALPVELADRVARAPATGASIISKSLGRWLSNRDGRWAGGLTVRCTGQDRDKIKRWRVVGAL